MANFIEAKVAYEKTLENGLQKRVAEPYLVDALSFTEAEKRIAEEVAPYISGEFDVAAVKKSNIAEVITSDKDSDDRFFKAKLQFITLDEKSGKEKRKNYFLLVQADTIKTALSYNENHMKGSVMDYVIASCSETAIMDVYKEKSA